MNLSRWRKGIAMDSYGESRNKQIQSDDGVVQGNQRSASTISSILNLNIRIAYIVMIQFRPLTFD